MRRSLRWLIIGIFSFLCLLIYSDKKGSLALFPPTENPRFRITLVSHGYHTGLILEREQLSKLASRLGHTGLISITERFRAYQWLEIGWGDENFYKNVPHLSIKTLPDALRALFTRNNSSVLHVVGFSIPIHIAFPKSDTLILPISEKGYESLTTRLEHSIWKSETYQSADLGEGLYGPSQFYRATGRFSILSVCNHWVGDLLNAAGIPINPILATLPHGLFADLRWRSGAKSGSS
jgi:uncharacterized protein (TIGR02117 family)